MNTLKITVENARVYLGNSYAEVLESIVTDILNDSSVVICELSHYDDINENVSGSSYKPKYTERILDPKKEFIRDRYKYFVNRRNNYVKNMTSEGREVFSKEDNIKTAITDEVIKNWCKNKINDTTIKIWESYIIAYNEKDAKFIKYTLSPSKAWDCNNHKQSKFIIVDVQRKAI